MKKKELRKKSKKDLELKLIKKINEYFQLNIQIKNKKIKKTHLLKKNRKEIARINTILTEKNKIKTK